MEEEKKVNQEQDEKKEEKKDHKLLILILLLLILFLGVFCFIKLRNIDEDPDVTLVKAMNESYIAYKANNAAAKDEHDAHTIIKERGYIIENGLLLKENRYVVWDKVNDCFTLYENDTIVYSPAKNPASGLDIWVYTRDVPSASRYSVFWCGTETVKEAVVVGKDKKGEDIIEEQDVEYTDHEYTRKAKSTSIVYTCEECGHTYTIKTIQ